MFRNNPIIRWRKYQERYSLEGAKCKKCKKTHYPRKHLCSCGSKEFVGFQLSGEGKLLSFTSIASAPESFAEYAPYCVGVVQLKEGPKIVAQLADCKLGDLKIGAPVMAAFRKFYSSGEKGAIHYGTKFVPRY